MAELPQDEPAPSNIPEPPPDPQPPQDFEPAGFRLLRQAFAFVVGPARALTDPHLFHKISLAAFLAWVGLGADGLSSSAYGPEAAFRALHDNTFLAIPLALLTAITVTVIAASYTRIIERFPAGGGGYVVATKLLGSGAGLVSGSALLVDYVLTVAISLAACSESIFSLVPSSLHFAYLPFTFGLLAVLTILNLRGVRESVAVISPIFLLFILTHATAIVAGIALNIHQIPIEVHHLREQSTHAVQTTGWIPLIMIVFRAFTLGGGTYTGIEAVSNGVPMLREPKAETAKITMRYMAFSLAVIAGALLFVAAQTGFLGGPRVLVYMALDRWVPSRFANLSERLVSSNGIFFMAGAAALTLIATGGAVHLLVVLYSINVFLTFALAQLGMCRDAMHLRREGKSWRRPLFISMLGFAVTGSLLIGTVSF